MPADEKTRPQREVPGERKVAVETARLIPKAPPPERRFLLDETQVEAAILFQMLAREKSGAAEARQRFTPHRAPALIPEKRPRGREPVDLRELREDFSHHRKRAWSVCIVAVQPAEDFARRPSNPIRDRRILPAIALAHPAREPRFVLPHDLRAPIRRAAIGDEVFQRRIALIEHRADRHFEKRRLIERRRDDRDGGRLIDRYCGRKVRRRRGRKRGPSATARDRRAGETVRWHRTAGSRVPPSARTVAGSAGRGR